VAVREILLLGDARLHEVCAPIEREEVETLRPVVEDLHDTLFDFRARWQAGRAIAAPQIGVARRLLYMHVGEPTVFVNPVLEPLGDETFELWDDCMSFPELLVRVARHRRVRLSWRDLDWREHSRVLEDDLSELLQHECDHLDGVLATERAVGPRAFALRAQRRQPAAATPGGSGGAG
jgi:peptide deformylase